MEEHLRGWYKTKRYRLVKLNRLTKSGSAPQEHSEEKWLVDNMSFIMDIVKRNRKKVTTMGGMKRSLKSQSKSKSTAKTYSRNQLPPNPDDRPVALVPLMKVPTAW